MHKQTNKTELYLLVEILFDYTSYLDFANDLLVYTQIAEHTG